MITMAVPSFIFILLLISFQSHFTATKPTRTFVELTKNPFYVDKTELLGTILNHLGNIFIASPNRFFKTSNLQMIRSFLQLEFDIEGNPKNYTDTETFAFFSQFKISNRENALKNHMANYPVLFMDFKYNVSQITRIKEAEALLNSKLRDLYLDYQEFLSKSPEAKRDFNLTESEILFMENLRQNKPSEDRTAIVYGLQNLCGILHKYFGRPVVILIDDYDYAANEIALKRHDFVRTELAVYYFYVLLNEMLDRALDVDQEFRSYAIVTGLNGYIGYADNHYRRNIHFADRNQQCNLASYYSFTEQEVDGLLTRNKCSKNEIEQVKMYYKGHLEGTYNPYSIIRYLESKPSPDQPGQLGPYWAQSETNEIIKQALKSASFRQKIQFLVDDRSAAVNFTTLPSNETEYATLDIIFRKIKDIKELFDGIWEFEDEYLFRYLHEIGYFNSTASSGQNLYSVPNEEIYVFLKELLATVEVPQTETPSVGILGNDSISVEVLTTQLHDRLLDIDDDI